MNVTYKKTKNLDPKKLLDLYHSIGWAKKANSKGAKDIAKAYKNSQIVISAWDKNKILGVVKGITDKITQGIVTGLVVHKNYQRQGIGRKLFFKCVKSYPKVKWSVRSAKNADKFYKKLKIKKDHNPWFEVKK